MFLNSESATKFCQIAWQSACSTSCSYEGEGSGSRAEFHETTFFFLKRLEFPEATKIIASSRNAQTKADHEDVGIHVQHVQIQSNTCIYKCSIYIEIYTYWSKSTICIYIYIYILVGKFSRSSTKHMFHHIAKLIWQSDIHVILGAQFEVPFFFCLWVYIHFAFGKEICEGYAWMGRNPGHFGQRALLLEPCSAIVSPHD